MTNINIEAISFSDQEKGSLVRYCTALQGVHARLVMEGYFLKGGKIWNIFKVGTVICEAVWVDNY